MRIGIASAISLELLSHRLDDWDGLTGTWSFPYIATLAEALIDRGHDVHVFALNDQIEKPVRFSGPSLIVDVFPMRANGRARVRDLYKAERLQIAEAINRADLDVVHAHWTYEFGAAAVESDAPTVVTAHDSPWAIVGEARHLTITDDDRHRGWAMVRNARRTIIRSLLAEQVVRKADVVTAVAPNVEHDLNQQFFSRQPVRMIPNGLARADRSPRDSVRDSQRPIYGFVSNGFGDRKNTVGALRAHQIVRASLPDAQLLLIGREHEANGPAHLWAIQQGLADGCAWMGELPHDVTVTTMRDDVDVLVHPSFWEACSIAIMEAQAFGIPVIGGVKSGGVAFSLQGGTAGVLVDVKKPAEVAEAMLSLAADPTTYSAVSQGGIRALNTVFELDRVMELYEQAFQDAIALHD